MKTLLFMLLLVCTSAFADSYTPATLNITISQGENFQRTWRLNQCTAYNLSGKCTASSPANLTGYSFRAALKTSSNSATMTNMSTSVSTGGVVTVWASPSKIAPLVGKTGYWDLLMVSPSNVLNYIITGQFTVKSTVTR